MPIQVPILGLLGAHNETRAAIANLPTVHNQGQSLPLTQVTSASVQ